MDPGKSGGFALVNEEGAIVLYSKFISWTGVHKHIKSYKGDIQSCAIEKVSSRRAQGAKSIFTFGMNYGGWLAYLELTHISHALIPPQRWQKMFLGSFPVGESKARSVDFINRRYPNVTLKKSDHGVSDAICLALYSLVYNGRIAGRRNRLLDGPGGAAACKY